MKPTLTMFVDYGQADLAMQKKMILASGIDKVALRTLDGRSMIEADETVLKDYQLFLLKCQVGVIILDPFIGSYTLDNEDEQLEFQKKWEKSLLIASQFKATNIYYRLPKFDDILHDKQILIEAIRKDLEIAKKSKIQVVLKFENSYKTNHYYYVLKHLEYPKLSVEFDPIYIDRLNESLTTTYRVFRESFHIVRLSDHDQKEYPRLLGLGRLKINDLFKRLDKQHYQGVILLDVEIAQIIEYMKKKPSFLTRMKASYKQRAKIHYDLVQRIGTDDLPTVLKHQLDVLKLMIHQ